MAQESRCPTSVYGSRVVHQRCRRHDGANAAMPRRLTNRTLCMPQFPARHRPCVAGLLEADPHGASGRDKWCQWRTSRSRSHANPASPTHLIMQRRARRCNLLR